MKPVILIISGPSGAGKSTLSKALVASIPDTLIAVSHTTRPRRPGEKDGEDYFFVSKEAFQKLINSGEMLESAEVYGNLYGTSRAAVESTIANGNNVILDVDWQGAQHIKTTYPDAVSVFILPPAGKEAEKRLLARQQDSEKTIRDRMSEYTEQISHQDEYDYTVINSDIQRSTRQLIDILASG